MPTLPSHDLSRPRAHHLASTLAGALLLLLGGTSGRAQQATVYDVAVAAGFQDAIGGHFQQGRALVAADFDLDGRPDFYVGNPGDDSLVLRNIAQADGTVRFEAVQALVQAELAWGAAAADYDNDGDYDLFVAEGGNEGVGFDRLFRNMLKETGVLSFRDVTAQAGVAGPVPPGQQQPEPIGSANGTWGDYDRDGWVDLFVNGSKDADHQPTRNILWHNQGDGTFVDVTAAAGLAGSVAMTRHSSWIDFDNDGDLDLFENNYRAANVLWRNQGDGTFVDVTAQMSPPGQNLGLPWGAFASAVVDLNNDGWQDIVVFVRDDLEPANPYGPGHAVFLNQGGTGFVNVADLLGINQHYVKVNGVMGCQVGDLNGDGYPDLFFGNGGPVSGTANQLFISLPGPAGLPVYIDRTSWIDQPAPKDPGLPQDAYLPYPYRTHGSVIVDVDGDGVQELAIANGGMAAWPGDVREPNRLFAFRWDRSFSFLKVRPVGDGVRVSRDAIGTRIAVSVSKLGKAPWTVWGTLAAGSAFSAQNGFEVYFGLSNADRIESVTLFWPDGTVQKLTSGLGLDATMVVQYPRPSVDR